LNAIGNTAQFGAPNGYFPFDHFKYTATGGRGSVERTFEGTTAGYFSLDGGITKGYKFNTHPDGDFGDWGESVTDDSFLAFSFSGVINAVSPMDIQVMDVLGWNVSGVSNTGVAGTASEVGGGGDRFAHTRGDAPVPHEQGNPRLLMSDATHLGRQHQRPRRGCRVRLGSELGSRWERLAPRLMRRASPRSALLRALPFSAACR
jgi:hypothetical protein